MDILRSWIRIRMKTYADPKHWAELEQYLKFGSGSSPNNLASDPLHC